jgi:adenosine deaminase
MHFFCIQYYFIGLGRWEMFELSRNAVEYIFADHGVKNYLKKYFNSVSKNMEV